MWRDAALVADPSPLVTTTAPSGPFGTVNATDVAVAVHDEQAATPATVTETGPFAVKFVPETCTVSPGATVVWSSPEIEGSGEKIALDGVDTTGEECVYTVIGPRIAFDGT
jgi:plastocyanin